MRISAISYLNTAPLMWDFEHGDAGKEFEISYTVPSQCAAELLRGSADIGIIPSAAYASVPGLTILPEVAIAAKQGVRSILLVGKKPIEQIRTVALDNSSLTSVALVRILFEKFWNRAPRFSSMAPNLEVMLAEHDAALLIGDPALKIDRSKFLTWDLGEEWIRFTGKPFVFAFWAVTQAAAERAPVDLGAIFQQSRDHGLEPQNLSAIAESWSPRLGMPRVDVIEYLTANIHYYLDTACFEGLQLFYRYAHECNIIPSVPELHFARAKPTLISP
jgi:chorismate dehydratase